MLLSQGLEFPNSSSTYNLKPVTRSGLELKQVWKRQRVFFVLFCFFAEHKLSSISFLLILQTSTGSSHRALLRVSLLNPSQFPGFNNGMRDRSRQEKPGPERSVSLQLQP